MSGNEYTPQWPTPSGKQPLQPRRCAVCGVPVIGQAGPLCVAHDRLAYVGGAIVGGKLTDWPALAAVAGPTHRAMLCERGRALPYAKRNEWDVWQWQIELSALLASKGVYFSPAGSTRESPGDAFVTDPLRWWGFGWLPPSPLDGLPPLDGHGEPDAGAA